VSLEDKIRYSFKDPNLLRLALTHRSVSSEDPSRNDNERLEFLGDAVLQLVVTDFLYGSYPNLAEGQMAKVRASVVSRPTLAEVARVIDLGTFIELAPAEDRTGGRGKDSILADALEAVLGAVYLDSSLDDVRKVILGLWADKVAERAMKPGVKDYKTRLQEQLARDGRRPTYEVQGTGPDHDRQFSSVVFVEGEKLGSGEGRSKKEAEQASAKEALEDLTSGSR
jgi:ribonuclease-3